MYGFMRVCMYECMYDEESLRVCICKVYSQAPNPRVQNATSLK